MVADVAAEKIPELHGLRRGGEAAKHPHHRCDLPRGELVDFEVLRAAHLDDRHELAQDRVQRVAALPPESSPPLADDVCRVRHVQPRVLPRAHLLHDVRQRKRGKAGSEHALRPERFHHVQNLQSHRAAAPALLSRCQAAGMPEEGYARA